MRSEGGSGFGPTLDASYGVGAVAVTVKVARFDPLTVTLYVPAAIDVDAGTGLAPETCTTV